MLELATFSIAARCARTGMLGAAVSTAVPGVGALCPFVGAGAGAVCTQSWVNPYLGIDGVRLMGEGKTAQQALDQLIAADPGREVRQLGLVDRNGGSAAWTGKDCTQWFGHITGRDFAVQGNMLVGEPTVRAMADAFVAGAALDLPERLIAVLEAGQAAGGDNRGRQSAALYVVDREEYPSVDLRVDEHPYPVAELRRIFDLAKVQLFPFTWGLPSRSNPLGSVSEETIQMLLTPPPQRPGGGGSAPD